MPEENAQLSAGARRLLEQHERNGGRTVLKPDPDRSKQLIARGFLAITLPCIPLMGGLFFIWTEDLMVCFVLLVACCFLLYAIGYFYASLYKKISRQFEARCIVDGEGIRSESPHSERRRHLAWSDVDAITPGRVNVPFFSVGWITLHLRGGAVENGEAAASREQRSEVRQQPRRFLRLSFSYSYTARRAEETAQFLMRLRERLHGRSLEEG